MPCNNHGRHRLPLREASDLGREQRNALIGLASTRGHVVDENAAEYQRHADKGGEGEADCKARERSVGSHGTTGQFRGEGPTRRRLRLPNSLVSYA